MSLYLGTAKVDISPYRPIALAGFGSRAGQPYEGVDHPIYARILMLEQEHHGETHRVLIVTADLLWWGSERMGAIRDTLSHRWGLRSDHVMFHASHSHSGPQTSSDFPFIGPLDEAYVRSLEQRLYDAITAAERRMKPVFVDRGSTTCDIASYRRSKRGDRVVIAPNPEGRTDPEVSIVRFVDEQGELTALMVHFTAHPVTTKANRLSPEYSGMAMEYVEQQLGGSVVSAFLQGCCGDINVMGSSPMHYCDGTFDDLCANARELSDAVLARLDEPMDRLASGVLTGRSSEVSLPLQEVPTLQELEQLADQTSDGGMRRWAGLLLDEQERLAPCRTLEFTRLDLADGLSLMGMNGEAVSEYGFYMKKMSAGAVLPLGYSNGMIGYLPTARQLEEGGYESVDSIYAFGLPAPYAAGLEGKIKEAMLNLYDDSQEQR